MKKQILVIVMILVVITCLLTVSVLSEEADKPIIQSVTVNPTEIVNGGEVTLTVIAKSNAPVNWLSSRLDGPNGNIYGGGSGVTFTNVGDDLWKYERTHTISEWDPSGTYTYSRISVENEGQLTSDEWGPVSFNVTNDHVAYKPIIQSVTVSPTEIVNGGEVTLTVIAKSNAPVNWLSSRLDGPNGNIYGGGSGVTFTDIGDDLWKHEHWPYTVSEWAPSGTYIYSRISVENEGQLTSDDWGAVSFNVTNDHVAYKPIIQSVTVSPTEIVNSGEVTLTVIAKSNAPVNWLSSRLDGPNGNIYGGGSGVTFTNVGDDLWKYERTHTISEWDPIGTYTYSHISVENEGQLTSDEWGPISFNVTCTTPPEITSYAPKSPVNDCVGVKRTFNITIDQTVNVSWQINGTVVHINKSVTEASYTNMSAVVGYWNVSAIASNANGSDMQTWIWNVTKASDLVITEKWLCWPENCTICYNVTNIGNGTASACHNTALYVDDVAVAHDHVPVDLAPGESYIGCFNGYEWTYTPPSDNVTVCADSNEALDELDEDNNCLTNIWMCGDVNCDGKVTMSDVRKDFNRYLDPNYPLDLSWAADVNCDGKVTMSDVRKVFNRYLDPGYELNCCCEVL